MLRSDKNLKLKYKSNGKILTDKNFSFAANTTYGCGGGAKIAYFPDTIQKAKLAYDSAIKGRFAILGNGSNVLASDKFFNGVVISTKMLSGIYRVSENVICVLAGTKIYDLINYCKRNNLGGLEYLYGIPASVGGAAYMNAGACNKYIGESIVKVRIYDGKISDLSNKECNFAYKQSTMRDINAIILTVFLKIEPCCDKDIIEQRINKVKALRANLPKGKSCGCVFKNPGGASAGKIIQECNFANFCLNGVRVSGKHCNFFINEGAGACDIKSLIGIVKREVKRVYSIELNEEVIYLGDFDDSDC